MFRPARGALLVAVALVLVVSLALPAGAAPTTQVSVVRYGWDNATEVANRTVTYTWMERYLPVKGDGVTPYYHQGPVFIGDRWDPLETKNFLEMGAVKGTALSDLCGLAGGMRPGDSVIVRAPDNEWKRFSYGTVYSPSARQGPPVLTWYRADDGYVPAYWSGMRIVFFADTSTNTNGWHVFGNSDMKASMPSGEWYYNFNNNELYPATTGLTIATVHRIEIYPAPPVAVPGGTGPPRDLDVNGEYEDVNGNGRTDFADIVLYFNQMAWISENESVLFFDYNANGRVDFADVVWLFNAL